MVLGWSNLQVQSMICMPGLFLTAYGIIFAAPNTGTLARKYRPTLVNSLITVVLLAWCVLSMAGVSTFLYFNF